MTTKRVNVNFSPSAYSTLEKLAQEKGKTMSEVLRDAIALEKYVTDLTKEGGAILVEKPDGKVREIIRR
jgi:predicted DNA-binding protein